MLHSISGASTPPVRQGSAASAMGPGISVRNLNQHNDFLGNGSTTREAWIVSSDAP